MCKIDLRKICREVCKYDYSNGNYPKEISYDIIFENTSDMASMFSKLDYVDSKLVATPKKGFVIHLCRGYRYFKKAALHSLKADKIVSRFIESFIGTENRVVGLYIYQALHELGHAKCFFTEPDNYENICEYFNLFHNISLLSITHCKTIEDKNFFGYRNSPRELYADNYAYTNFIKTYKHLESKNLVPKACPPKEIKCSSFVEYVLEHMDKEFESELTPEDLSFIEAHTDLVEIGKSVYRALKDYSFEIYPQIELELLKDIQSSIWKLHGSIKFDWIEMIRSRVAKQHFNIIMKFVN